MTDNKYLERFDGTKREPREIQRLILNSIQDQNKSHVVIANTGIGKTAISMAVSLATGADIITGNNNLISQFSIDYPGFNILNGMENYSTEREYKECKVIAKTRATLFNPASYLFFNRFNVKEAHTPTLVIDEAHSFLELVKDILTVKLSQKRYGWPNSIQSLDSFLAWVTAYTQRDPYSNDSVDLMFLAKHIRYCRENYVFYTIGGHKDAYLYVTPWKIPSTTLKWLYKNRKVIFMSATLSSFDIAELTAPLGEVDVHEFKSSVNSASKNIIFDPLPNRVFNPKLLVKHVERIIKERGMPNTLVHMTYAQSKECKKHWTIPVITHDKADKSSKLNFFIENGGVFIGSGCHDGLNFYDDLCRLNIVTYLPYPYLGDPLVKAMLKKPFGEQWYKEKTFTKFRQQLGRSIRHQNDTSDLVCCDPLTVKFLSKIPSHGYKITWVER